ncbi:SEC14 cytosolic factor [Seminavis robusta]|uniref:SEC14 cytosolic factor n=1 Tax=Seminavis robusta TaxID=568900 RepID=A0A9N8E965_9STRA|nr:SEC14 cytosolic factor [Seminavis robusta]|eukprot:Sro764_g199100.1 SEC14 cytosolic factor (460) ;mRNA; f:40402-41866
MPSVPGPEGFPEDRSVLRSLLSALAFDNVGSRRGSSSKRPLKRRKKIIKKRRDCLGRACQEDDTVDENESQTYHLDIDTALEQPQQQLSEEDQQLLVVDPSFVDIFYDAKDRESVEALLDEDLIPIGLEPDDSVMLESFEACIRSDGGIDTQRSSHDDSSSLRRYQVPLECAEESIAGSCSTLSASDAPSKEAKEVKTNHNELPVRFLRAGKGDEVEGRRRYQETLQWRKDNGVDNALYDAWPMFELTKKHYPHYFHGTGRNGQPVFYEQPPKTDLRALRNGGVGLQQLLNHYAMITEFQWQYIERDDFQRSIYIIDLGGIRMTDFVGECVDFVRQASSFTAAHYPERAGHVFVVNVPGWFKIIWNVVKPMIDEVTLEKIHILRGKEEIFKSLLEQIPVENIPQEYGGQSCYKLGESPEEDLLRGLMTHNNEMAEGKPCRYAKSGESCKFCNFSYARHY